MHMRWLVYLTTLILAGAAGDALVGSTPVGAVSREIVGLEQSMQQLMQGQKTLETGIAQDGAVKKTLIELSIHSVGELSEAANTVQKTVQETLTNSSTRLDTISAQIQAISDGLQEAQARARRLSEQLADTQNVIQGIDSKLPSPRSPAAVPKPKVPRA